MKWFQFTHPVRGATHKHHAVHQKAVRFNSRIPCGVRLLLHFVGHNDVSVSIHAPRAGCDALARSPACHCAVSIHAPRAGCDYLRDEAYRSMLEFQFTHPVRGATLARPQLGRINAVSIHAPRAGCDTRRYTPRTSPRCFNSRTPCGVRRFTLHLTCVCPCFNSRTPCGVRPSMSQ